MILESALLCLSLNIWHEARGEQVPGQYAVAQVTMNRAAGDQNNVCRVVYAPKQFSWTHQKVRHKSPVKVDPAAWERSKIIARVVLERRMQFDFSKGADHYHAVYVAPKWSKRMKRTTVIGNHRFYQA